MRALRSTGTAAMPTSLRCEIEMEYSQPPWPSMSTNGSPDGWLSTLILILIFIAKEAERKPVVGESLLTITDVTRFLSVTEEIANWLGQSAQIPAFKVGLREAGIWNWLEE